MMESTATPPRWLVSAVLLTGRALRWTWRALLTFLEIIGLLKEHRVEQQEQLAGFKLRHAEFRKLLTANNAFLEDIAELEKKLHGGEFYDAAWLKRKVVKAVVSIHHMINSINAISSGRYAALQPVFERITAALNEMVEGAAAPPQDDLALDMAGISRSHADIVGGKMANLSEIRHALGLPTPYGFAITTEACRLVFDDAGVSELIQTGQLKELLSDEGVAGLSDRLRARILNTPLPPASRTPSPRPTTASPKGGDSVKSI